MAYLFTFFGWMSRLLGAAHLESIIKATNVFFGLLDGALIVAILRRLQIGWRWGLIAGALFILNPAVWFSTSIWGQTHVISLFLILLAILLAEYDHPVSAWLALGLATLTRPQMLVFGLIVGVVLLRRFGLWRNVYAISWTVIAVFLLMFPFTSQTSPSLPVDLLANTVHVQELGGNEKAATTVSLDAYSFWPLVTDFQAGASGLNRILYPSDSPLIGPLTYQLAGLVLTALVLIGVIWALVTRPKSALLGGGYVPALAFGIAGFLMFTTGLAATHFILALPFILMTRRWLSANAYYSIVAGWTATTLLAMYGILALDLAFSDFLHVPLFGPHGPLSSVSSLVAGLYSWDRMITFGVLANLAVLFVLLVAMRRSLFATVGFPAGEGSSTWRLEKIFPAQLRANARQVGLRIGDIRSPWFFRCLLALGALTLLGLVYLTSYKNFFYDEWDFVTAYRPGQSTSILFPHNEHWSTIPILLWEPLLAVFGLRTHIPYSALAVAMHVVCAVLLFLFVRRHAGDLLALGAAATLLLLGTGAVNIVWAFQFAWTLSIALGLLALILIDGGTPEWSRWRIAALAALLLGSVMSSGIGLGFLVAVAVRLLVDRRRRRLLLAVAIPLVAYVVWFVTYGAGIPGTPGAPCPSCPTAFGTDLQSLGPGYIGKVAAYVALGVEASAAGLIGMTWYIGGPIALVLVGALLAWHWYVEGRIESWELGLLAGLLAQFTLIAIVRARFNWEGAADPHYVYVGVVYLLPLAANALKHFSWNSAWRPVLIVGTVLAVAANATLLAERSVDQKSTMQTENAELRVVELFRGAPDMALDRPLDNVIMPQLTARRYFAAIDQLGSPVPTSTPRTLDQLPASAVDQEMITLFRDGLTVKTASSSIGPCRIDDTTGSNTQFQVPSGGTVVLRSSRSRLVSLSLGVLAPTSRPLLDVQITDTTPQLVHVPDTGKPIVWRLTVDTTSVGDLQVCPIDQAIRS
jgi:hypothetical protein